MKSWLTMILLASVFLVMIGCAKQITPVPTPTAPSPAPSAEEVGRQLFLEKGCVGCHRINGEGGDIGPSLFGITSHTVELTTGETITRDHEYLEESILNPDAKVVKGYQPGIMPKGGLTHEEIHQIEDFLRSLR